MAAKGIPVRPLHLRLGGAPATRPSSERQSRAFAANAGDLAREYSLTPGTGKVRFAQNAQLTRRHGRGTFVNSQSPEAAAGRCVGRRLPGSRCDGPFAYYSFVNQYFVTNST
jgi:hypothetical protein